MGRKLNGKCEKCLFFTDGSSERMCNHWEFCVKDKGDVAWKILYELGEEIISTYKASEYLDIEDDEFLYAQNCLARDLLYIMEKGGFKWD